MTSKREILRVEVCVKSDGVLEFHIFTTWAHEPLWGERIADEVGKEVERVLGGDKAARECEQINRLTKSIE